MLPLLKAKKDINDYIANAEVRLRLVNDKLAEVELQKINADVFFKIYRQLMHLKILINILSNCKMSCREGIGKMCYKRLKINTNYNGLINSKTYRMIRSFKPCGNN